MTEREATGNKSKLIAFDLDGTLFDRGRVSEANKRALEEARACGCTLAVSTGRSFSGLKPTLKGVPADYFITSNGARITDAANGVVLSQSTLDCAVALDIMDELRPDGALFSLQLFDSVVFERGIFRRFTREHEPVGLGDLWGLLRFAAGIKQVRSVKPLVSDDKNTIEKLSAVFPDGADLVSLCGRLEKKFPIEAAESSKLEIEMTARGVTKGAALARLSERIGIDKADVIAFGDSGNDASMRSAAGCFVAMGNADDRVKALADIVADTAKNDGLAKALEGLL